MITKMKNMIMRSNNMEQIENLIARDEIIEIEELDDDYYDGLLEWMDDNRE